MKKLLLGLLILFKSYILPAQASQSFAPIVKDSNISKSNILKRKVAIGAASVVGAGVSLGLFYKSSDYQYNKEFNKVNDLKAWLQVDKMEHGFIAYRTSRLLYNGWKWAHLPERKSVIVSSATTLGYLMIKEFLDGHKLNWGWSYSDMGANVSGIALFASQELTWHEQKILLKVSAFPKKYDGSLNERANQLFGNTLLERVLKDHNVQTYWMSVNLQSITGVESFPSWLNLAVGYGAQNLFGTYQNLDYNKNGVEFDRTDLKRYRQWYLSPDIDLTRFKTKNKLVRTVLFALNAIKIPLPTLELSNQKLKGHIIHF